MDLPYFTTASQMATFMANHYVGDASSLDGSYYPPYFRNTIKLSKSVDFDYENGSCNYLSLESEDGYIYYYFIDRIDYISPDVYSIDIHMDTIMTYWFNIRVSAFMIERAFINRWGPKDSIAINRDYIRENYSNGKYKIKTHTIVDGMMSDNWVVIAEINKVKFTESGDSEAPAKMCNNWSQPTKQIFIDINGNNLFNSIPQQTHKQGVILWSFVNSVFDTETYTLNDREAYYVYPDYTYTSPLTGATFSVATGKLDNPINQLINNPNLHNIFIIPFIPFSKDISITKVAGSRTYNITLDPMYMNFGGRDKPANDPIKLRYGFVRGAYNPNMLQAIDQFDGAYADKMSPFAPIRSVVKNSTFAFGSEFTKNTSIGIAFSKNYCPQLIDTNYIQVTFGSLYANTTYPIEYLTLAGLYGKYYADCFTGKRYYYITNSSTSYNDTYCTIVCDDNILSLEMLNDPWKDYEANNRSRWATIGVGAGVNAVKDLIGIAGIAGGMGAINDAANLNKYIYSSQISNRKKSRNNDILRARVALTEIDRKEDIRSSQMGMLKSGIGILDSATAVTSQLEKEYNLQHAPQSVIRGGDETSVVSSQGWAIRWIRRDCENIEQVAQIYHRIGYNVKRYVNDTCTLLETLGLVINRYYYNIIQLGECAVHIEGKMENEDITSDIMRRLQQGFRFWNTTVTGFALCDFQYDNVENDYL